MSYIKLHNSRNLYSRGTSNLEVDQLVNLILKRTLAQHIPDDGRLEATLEAVKDDIERYISIHAESKEEISTIKDARKRLRELNALKARIEASVSGVGTIPGGKDYRDLLGDIAYQAAIIEGYEK